MTASTYPGLRPSDPRMPPEFDAILKAVFADPHDDLPRLACADYYEDHCTSDADLALLELARMPGTPSVTYQPGGRGWSATPIPRPLGPFDNLPALLGRAGYYARDLPPAEGGPVTYTFRLGFLDRIDCPLAWWMAHGRAMAQLHPLTGVGAADRRPKEWRMKEGYASMWIWALEEGAGAEPHRLPNAVLKQMQVTTAFATPAHALDALSAALLAWAREGK